MGLYVNIGNDGFRAARNGECNYTDSLLDYVGEVVLVGINYNKRTKQHQCKIERITKAYKPQDKSVPTSDKKVYQPQDKSVPTSDKKVYQPQGKSVPTSDKKMYQPQDKSVLSIIEIRIPLSFRQRETALLVVKQFLENKEISIPDLMQKVGATNRSRFKSKIIDSLIDAEIICPVFIDSPTNPNQKYILTEKAKRQLGQ